MKFLILIERIKNLLIVFFVGIFMKRFASFSFSFIGSGIMLDDYATEKHEQHEKECVWNNE